MPTVFLVVACVGAMFTLLALTTPRHPAVFSFPIFMIGWATGELALFHLAWQAIATIVFVALGALNEPGGWIGLAITLASWTGLWVAERRQGTAAAILDEALHDTLAEEHEATIAGDAAAVERIVSRRQLLSPFRMRTAGIECTRDIEYGEHHRNKLDVYRPAEAGERRPVLLQIHGGAWVIGNKRQQGQPLMHHLAERGWVCVAPNYRLSPKATFPDHLVDVKRALAWVRTHIAESGGDPDFVVVTGGSAGGHLASFLALTANQPQYQPGLEGIATSVAACVPMYGVYDFLDRHRVRGRASMRPFLQPIVMKCSPKRCPELWEAASPISHVRADAPPFLVIHGRSDSLAWVEDARYFVDALREVSESPVLYAELPYTQHAFDVMYTVRTARVAHSIGRWLEHLHGGRESVQMHEARLEEAAS
ncbi:MAG: alpha/beta hydrolase [Acidimicrobiia bacterium]